jgi:hypothetical protein
VSGVDALVTSLTRMGLHLALRSRALDRQAAEDIVERSPAGLLQGLAQDGVDPALPARSRCPEALDHVRVGTKAEEYDDLPDLSEVDVGTADRHEAGRLVSRGRGRAEPGEADELADHRPGCSKASRRMALIRPCQPDPAMWERQTGTRPAASSAAAGAVPGSTIRSGR